MKFSLMTAIIISTVASTTAFAEEAKQKDATNVEFTTTQEYLAQPNIETIQDIEPAAGAVASNDKNPLLERKFQNYKR